MKKIYTGLVVLLASFLSNCATIIHGSRQEIIISSQPRIASISIDGRPMGNTPLTTRLKRGSNHWIKVELPGYLPYEMEIQKRFDGWIFGNLVFGGLFGIFIDIATGSMYRLTPKDINSVLIRASSARSGPNGEISIVLVLKPDPGWEKIGQLSAISAI